MNIKLCYCIGLLFVIGSCNPKKKELPISTDMLIGGYCNNEYSGDSIFIYSDKSYVHKYYRKDGGVDSVKSTWNYKPENNDIFFENFKFYSDFGPSEFSGSWPSKVSVSEEGVKLQYSESIYYVKDNTP